MELKDRILQKAADLFHRYGVRSITMDEIASQLGVSKKTIYQYYSDKDELVDRVISEIIGNAQFNCEMLKADARNAIHEIFQVMDFIKNMFTNMNPAMVFDLNRFHPKAYKLFLNYKNQYLYQMIKDNLERGVREGLYRPEINIEIIVKLRLEGMSIAFNPDVFPPAKYNLAEIQQAVVEHFLFGVASLKGYRLVLKYQKESLKVKK